MRRDKDDAPLESRTEAEDRIELENALIALVVRHGARVVMETAQDLYAQTKEGKEEAAALSGTASEERWERHSQAADTRGGGANRGRAWDKALKDLGF